MVFMPRRKPDVVIVYDDSYERFEYQVYFKNMVLKVKKYDINNGLAAGRAYTTDSMLLERWVSSKGRVRWEAENFSGHNLSLAEDDYYVCGDAGLENKLEKAYQSWLANQELEKILK